MDYSFIRTIHGPMIVGSQEVISFTQHVQMYDYYLSDPEFLGKAKSFISETIEEYAQSVRQSLYEFVTGEEYYSALHHYVNAAHMIRRFENHFLPQQRTQTTHK